MFSLRPGVLIKTLSHIWGRLNLPILLLRVGLLTLIKMHSLECLSSYDVLALFTSVPIDPALKFIKDILVKDPILNDRRVIGIDDIILLLEFCLKNTYFSFQGQSFEQVEYAAMGSPVCPIAANLYMEYLEQKALSTAPHPPASCTGLWMTPLLSTRKSINKASFNT